MSRGHIGDFFKHAAKILRIFKTQKVGNLGYGMVIFSDKIFSLADFKLCKILDNSFARARFKPRRKIRAAKA